jgi:ClpP class serine protease
MSGDAVLGPVDPQLGQYPAAFILKAVARKPIERAEDQTLILADQSEKAMSQVRESVRELLADNSRAIGRSVVKPGQIGRK